jgi:hypothetical protein
MPRSLDELLDKLAKDGGPGSGPQEGGGKRNTLENPSSPADYKAKRAAWEKKNGAVPKGAKESEAYYLKMRNELGVAPR